MTLTIAADCHLADDPSLSMGLDTQANFNACAARIRELAPDHVVLLGDYSFDTPRRRDLEWLAGRMTLTGAPYAAVAGNHDAPADVAAVLMREELLIGSRLYYRRDFGRVRCLFLDTSPGDVDAAQLAWVRQEIAGATGQVIAFMHHPPARTGVAFMDREHALRGAEVGGPVYAALFGGRRPVTVFCGHHHSARSLHIGPHTVHVCPSTAYQIDPVGEAFRVAHAMPALRHVEVADGEVRTWVEVLPGEKRP